MTGDAMCSVQPRPPLHGWARMSYPKTRQQPDAGNNCHAKTGAVTRAPKEAGRAVPTVLRRVIDLGCCRFDEMADAPGDRDTGGVEAAFTALRGAENPADVFALGGLLAKKQPHVRPSRFLLFMELLGSRMPSTTEGSSKQAACGGDRFYGMKWRVRGRCVAGSVRAESRGFRERAWNSVDVGGAIPWG